MYYFLPKKQKNQTMYYFLPKKKKNQTMYYQDTASPSGKTTVAKLAMPLVHMQP